MSDLLENSIAESIPWFRRWFDSTYYHKLYAHRNEDEAKTFIDLLVHELTPVPGSCIMDVGCGSGRHAKHLASKGFRVTGIDLAFSNIREAKKSETNDLYFYRHDMRLPFGKNSFNYVFNFFTSFGYFENEGEHTVVIQNMAEALKPGGVIVLDYLNPYYTERRMLPEEHKEIDGIAYKITRWSDAAHIYKTISIIDDNVPGNFQHTEKVAKFTIADFRLMFQVTGLSLDKVFGDYDLNDFDTEHSPRQIMIVTK